MRHERMINEEKYNKAAMENALMKEFGRDEKQADLNYRRAQTQDLLDPISPQERAFKRIYGANTPEFKKALATYYGTQSVPVPGSKESEIANTNYANKSPEELRELEKNEIQREKRGVFSNGQKLSALDVNERLHERKRMDAELAKADSGKKVVKLSQQLRELNNKYPKLQETFSALVQDPDNYSALKQAGSFIFDSAEERRAVEVFRKISQQMANEQATLKGGTRGASDFRLASTMKTKPSERNTMGANNVVLDDIIEDAIPNISYSEALRNSLSSSDPTLIYPDASKYADRALYNKEHYGIKGPIFQSDYEKTKDKDKSIEKISKIYKLDKKTASDVFDTSNDNNMTVERVMEILEKEGKL